MKTRTFIAIICLYFVLILYVVLANIFQLPLFKYGMVLPVSFLAVVAFIAGRRIDLALPVALALSAVGDYFGASGIFLAQQGSFALAHIAYTVYLLRHAWIRPKLLLASLPIIAAAILLGMKLLPGVAVTAERIGVITYIVLITAMAVSSVMWHDKNKGWYIAAALLFMFSDAILAWHRYAGPIPYRSIIVMGTYYSSQLIFAACYIYRFVKRKGFNPAYPF